MINTLYQISSPTTNPYENLALEAYLLDQLKEGEGILYLWQNKHTVVIGKNQNSWKECNISKLVEEGGYLARRLSGGGAVFHDLGNLNFTFLMKKEDYDVSRQMDVILEAVKNLGIQAEKSGRNDVTVDGRKFSGNAFYQKENACFHHGTIMVSVDFKKMQDYLNVSKEKLQSKGVGSVRSRVANLTEFNPQLTIDELRKSLLDSFGLIYEKEVTPFPKDRLNIQKLKNLEDQFSSWDFIYGRKIAFTTEYGKRFSWGDITLQVAVNEGRIKEALCYSDSLNPQIIHLIEENLIDCIFEKESMRSRIQEVPALNAEEKIIREDIALLLE